MPEPSADADSSTGRDDRLPGGIVGGAGATGAEIVRTRVGGGANPRRAVRAHLGDALRRLITAAVSTDAGDVALAETTAEVERLAGALGQTATRWPTDDIVDAEPGTDMFVTHPLVGAANPLAPPLAIEVADDGEVTARVTYGPASEGLPGKVYGGFIAEAFDGMTIFASVAGGHTGVTGSLSMRFERTTPIGVEVVYRGSLARVDGRKGFVEATLHDPDGNVCVSAEGVVITPRGDFLRRDG